MKEDTLARRGSAAWRRASGESAQPSGHVLGARPPLAVAGFQTAPNSAVAASDLADVVDPFSLRRSRRSTERPQRFVAHAGYVAGGQSHKQVDVAGSSPDSPTTASARRAAACDCWPPGGAGSPASPGRVALAQRPDRLRGQLPVASPGTPWPGGRPSGAVVGAAAYRTSSARLGGSAEDRRGADQDDELADPKLLTPRATTAIQDARARRGDPQNGRSGGRPGRSLRQAGPRTRPAVPRQPTGSRRNAPRYPGLSRNAGERSFGRRGRANPARSAEPGQPPGSDRSWRDRSAVTA